jgi:hypothetical protein
MPIAITTADERLAERPRTSVAIVAPSGTGKTYLARSLPPTTTLVLDGESGLKALGRWGGKSIDIRKQSAVLGVHPWELCRALACILAGPDTSDYLLSSDGPVPGSYSPEMHAQYIAMLGDFEHIYGGIHTVFADSITVASRWSFAWSKGQPAAISEKTGKPDTRGAYGLHGQEMVKWLTTLQHSRVNIVVVGILDRVEDEMHHVSYTLQVDGGKTGMALPGIFDQIVTLAKFDVDAAGSFTHNPNGETRAFVTAANPWGFPAKDRSDALEMLEPADLGRLLAKIATGKVEA